MIRYSPATRCRSSGESLNDAALLFEVADCPFPGIYPGSPAESLSLHSPLRVVQAQESGLVQLAHVFDAACYENYLFTGSVSRGYTTYLKGFTQSVANLFSRNAAIMEVGCGDGTLLGLIQAAGFTDVFGIDPGQPARHGAITLPIASGYFPADMPPDRRNKQYDLIILRHVLEHLETPAAFVAGLAAALKPTGQLWIEVPDLESAIRKKIWGNFYQLHCNYFEAATLDALLGGANLVCQSGEVVEVFGGSLLRRYASGRGGFRSAPTRWEGIGRQVLDYQRRLFALADQLPTGCVGYGAAERTAVTLGFCPALRVKLRCLYDGNALLNGRFFGGTTLPILHKDELFQNPPSAIVLFAISHATEIIEEFKRRLPGHILIGMAGAGDRCRPLADFFVP